MVEVTQEAIEEAAPLLDNALGFPCSEAQAERILEALSPMIDAHRQAGVQQGLDMAAGGWVIGDADGKRWRSWGPLGPIWVADLNEATRYHRRCDAENVHGCDEDAWLVMPFSAAIRKLGVGE